MQIQIFLQPIPVPEGVSGGPPLDVDLKIHYMVPLPDPELSGKKEQEEQEGQKDQKKDEDQDEAEKRQDDEDQDEAEDQAAPSANHAAARLRARNSKRSCSTCSEG